VCLYLIADDEPRINPTSELSREVAQIQRPEKLLLGAISSDYYIWSFAGSYIYLVNTIEYRVSIIHVVGCISSQESGLYSVDSTWLVELTP